LVFLKMFKQKQKKAFTLIELMVVIAISAVVATMVFSNMRSGGRAGDVNASAEKLAGVVKQAQMMSLSGKLVDESRPTGGYGVYIDTLTSPHSYKLFADTFNVGNHEYDSGNDTVIQTIEFGEQIDSTPSQTSIIFIPPRGTIWVSVGAGGSLLTGSDTALVLLQHIDANFYAYVRINSQGEIDVRKTE